MLKLNLLVIALFMMVPSAHAQMVNGPNTFSCNNSPGQTCAFTGYGQTLSANPIQINASAQGLYTYSHINADANLALTVKITKLQDPTDFYDAYGNLAVTAIVKTCSPSEGQCYWASQSFSFTMNRTYGTREFDNSPGFTVNLPGNGGAEEWTIVSEIDFWLPQQQYPVIVKF
jgi:hypothetical protein